jgi:predicted alpha-1,2-mannosidase
LGGKDALTKKLNDFFTTESKNPNKFLGQEAMIGQYAHGNEPGHHILYLYAYANEPKTGQKYIHQVISKFHSNTPNGLIGNDDCGQMSAWYILSSLGFYPVNPASNEFVLGAPQLKKTTLHLANGKAFTMEAVNISSENIYHDKVFLNGRRIETPFITYAQIVDGGNLKFEMTNK